MDAKTEMDVCAIRKPRAQPYGISTVRHIPQGGVSLLDDRRDPGSKTLTATSAMISGDPYVLTVHLPQGFRLASAQLCGEMVEIANQTETATARIVPATTQTIGWKLKFTH
jgi:hypothetical protein